MRGTRARAMITINRSRIKKRRGRETDPGCVLDQWGVEKLFQNSDEAITTELKLYIEYWEKLNTKNKSQVSKYIFLARYGSLDLYDEDLEKVFQLKPTHA